MEYYHCTKCGNLYKSPDIPLKLATAGIKKGEMVPTCCRKALRLINEDIYNQVMEENPPKGV